MSGGEKCGEVVESMVYGIMKNEASCNTRIRKITFVAIKSSFQYHFASFLLSYDVIFR